MRRLALLAFAVTALGLGCGDRTPRPRGEIDLVDAGGKDAPTPAGPGTPTPPVEVGTNPPPPADALAPTLPEQDRYEAALLKAVDFLAERRHPEALAALEEAQKVKDTGTVQREIDKVRATLTQQAAAEKAVTDVKTVLDEGKADDAARLASAALGQHGGGDQAQELARLKQQADAVVTASADDGAARLARLTAEADAAEKQQNFRAAALALEQATALKPDETLAARLDALRDRLRTYDDNRARATEARKEPTRLEESLTRLQAARKAWDTLEVKQEIDEVTLIMERRRDRLSVVDFEVRGDVGIAGIGRTVGEELLGHFKPRFDPVERSQVARVLDELKLTGGDLTDVREGGAAVARLARVRYLVVGSVTPLAGVTVQARLVEVATGLVVQTARVSAPDLEALLPRLKELAVVLQMSDDQKAAYEDRVRASLPVVAVKPIEAAPLVELPPPPPLPAATAPPPPPLVTYTQARPAVGNLVVEDYQRLPVIALVPAPPPPALAVALTRDDPRRHRLFRLSLELGDNLFRRRRFAEANRHFGLALSLGGPRRELTLRLDACRDYLPPPPPPAVVVQAPAYVQPVIGLPEPYAPPVVVVAPPPLVRPRVAVFGFNIYCRPGLVPAASSELLADQFASYCGGAFDVIDRGEVCWHMGRLGLTMADLLRDPVSRRCLAQSLNVRFLVFGTIQETASFNVETHLFDATTGDRTAAGKIHVQDHAEMKLRMGELAQQIGAKPADRAALVKKSAAGEKSITEARSLLAANQPGKAAEVARAALAAQPGSVALQTLAAEADRKQKLAAFEEARRKGQAERARAEAAARKRQEELTKAAEAARLRAAADARGRDAAARERLRTQKEAAAAVLRQQAAVASKGGDPARAAQLLQSAAGLAPAEATFKELAQAQVKAAEAKRLADAAEQKKRDAARAAQQKSALARVRQEQQARAGADAERRKARDAQEKSLHDAYLKQASAFIARKDFTAALAAAESARQHGASDESAKLLAQARNELARADADRKGAAERAKLDRERKDREAADARRKRDQEAYLAALKKGQEAVLARRYDEAIGQYAAASKLFRTDAALNGLKTATDLQARQRKAAEDQKAAAAAAAQRSARTKELLTQGNAALAKKDFARAVELFSEAKKVAPDSAEALAGLGKAQRERDALAQQQQRRDADARAAVGRQLAAGKAALAKKQYAEAAAAFRGVLRADAGNAEARALLARAEKGPGTTPPVTTPGTPRRDEDYKLAMSAGLAAYKKANWAGAINSYNEALRLRPRDDAATAGLNQARLGQAQAAYADAMKRGQATLGAKKWADAAAAFDEALKARPGDPAAVKGKRDAAEAARKPATPPPPRLSAEDAYKRWMAAAQAAATARKWPDAVKAYDAALAYKPGDAAATAGKNAAVAAGKPAPAPAANPQAEYAKAAQQGAALEGQKKYAEAAAAYAVALRWVPGDPATSATLKTQQANAYAGLARADHAQKKYAEAAKAYEEVLKRVPTDAAAKAGLAKARANKP